MISKKIRTGLFLVGMLATAAAQAAYGSSCGTGFICYYGLNTSDLANYTAPPGSTSPLAPAGDPVLARGEFLAAVAGQTSLSENFSSFDPYDPVGTTLSTFGNSATISGSGGAGATNFNILSNELGNPVGRYDTTGVGPDTGHPLADRFLQVQGAFTIAFEQAITAFGFYGTDIGDFGDVLDGATPMPLSIQLFNGVTGLGTFSASGSTNNGSLLFWGITSAQAFDRIVITGGTQDGLGFDDMILARGEVTNQTPEPASIALGGLALLALSVVRRRRH